MNVSVTARNVDSIYTVRYESIQPNRQPKHRPHRVITSRAQATQPRTRTSEGHTRRPLDRLLRSLSLIAHRLYGFCRPVSLCLPLRSPVSEQFEVDGQHRGAVALLLAHTSCAGSRAGKSHLSSRRQKIATRVKRPKPLATYCNLDVRHMHEDPHAQEQRRRCPASGQHEIEHVDLIDVAGAAAVSTLVHISHILA